MMKLQRIARALFAVALWVGCSVPALAQGEVTAGTRFLVELRDDLKASKVKEGKKFEARTIEALRLDDGSVVPAGAKLKGRVAHADDDELLLRFETIETRRGKAPIIARVTRVIGEKNVKEEAGDEGQIRATGNRGKRAAIGAAVGGGVGAAIGAAKGGGKGAAIGAGAGAGTGAVVGAASGGSRDLELHEGVRLELILERPLVIARR